MLTPNDEILAHQLPTTFDHVSQSDLRWVERVCMYGFDKSGEICVMTGMARFPNRNVTDAYAMVTKRNGDTKVVRMSTELNPQSPAPLGVYNIGPFTYSVEEPLRATRTQLSAPEQGLSLDLRLRGQYEVYEQTPAFHRGRGRVIEDARRYYQNGAVEGWIEVDGERIEIDTANWWFGRDHSWGIRTGSGGGGLPESVELQPREIPEGVLYYMGIFQFDDELVHFAQREHADGSRWQFEGEWLYPLGSDRAADKIIDVRHDLKFRDDLRVVSGGTFTVVRGDRSEADIEITPSIDFWPALGGYDEYRGYASGYHRGKDFIDSFTVNTSDAEAMAPARMVSETLCQVEMNGKVGHGLVEMLFVGAYPRYGYTGW
jgi:hypothetical protein